jgi:hypothetical protein
MVQKATGGRLNAGMGNINVFLDIRLRKKQSRTIRLFPSCIYSHREGIMEERCLLWDMNYNCCYSWWRGCIQVGAAMETTHWERAERALRNYFCQTRGEKISTEKCVVVCTRDLFLTAARREITRTSIQHPPLCTYFYCRSLSVSRRRRFIIRGLLSLFWLGAPLCHWHH